MGNCCSKPESSESMNRPHHVSTPSSPLSFPTSEDPVRRPAMKSSLPASGDPMGPPPDVEHSLPASVDPVAPSSAVEHSLSASGDPVRPSPAGEHSLPASRDPVGAPDVEHSLSASGDPVCPSPAMDSSRPTSGDAVLSSPPMYTVESISEMLEEKDPVELIDLLVSFIETQIGKMNNPSEGGPSSSQGRLDTVLDVTKLAATTLDTISTEAEKLSESDVVKAMGSLTLKMMKGAGQLHWVFLGLSVAASAIDSYVKAGRAKDECTQILLKILELAKDVKKFAELMPEEEGKVRNVVRTIVLGAVVCCNYVKRGKFFSSLSATKATAQLEEINKQLNDARNYLSFSLNLQTHQKFPRRPEQSPLDLLEFQPVGIENQVREVEALLDMKGTESALAVVVYGFGGVGKSTLAASVVQSLDWSSKDFKFCRVAIDEKASATPHIIYLQKRILYVLGRGEVGLGDTFEGRREIKQALENKYCLLFIDNVVDKYYIKELLPQNLTFPSEQNTKLRIIITSRENNLSAELKMRRIVSKEYGVKCLSPEASKQLLMETILVGDIYFFEEEFEEEERMITELAVECRGVPLLLSVFGSHLSVERNKDSYEDALNFFLREGDLDIFKNEDLGKRLMYVYHKIKEPEVKEAFLDICTYFHGWEWNHVIDIVDFHQIEDLHRRALVSKSSSGEVIVHEILRFMGMKEDRFTRFSNYEELSSALQRNLVNFENVKGVSLLNDNRLITINSAQLDAMHKSLRVLMLGDWVKVDGPPCHSAFSNLRCLRVGDIAAFPLEDPSKMEKLRVFLNRSEQGMNLFDLPPSLIRVSHEVPVDCDKFVKLPFQNLSSLKRFIVKTQKSVELPEELDLPTSLLDLHLNSCKNLPKDIGHLTNLESFILDNSDLESLLEGFGKLKKLKLLSIDNCSKLAVLSDDLGMLSSLEVLSMKGCRNLNALPENLGGLTSLQTIEFSECIKLQELPESFGKLRIQLLNLHFLVKLIKLPNSIGNMTVLKDLTLESCQSLISLPDTFVQLKMLETLKIIKCTKLDHLPENFGGLTCLKSMTVEECHLLKELPRGFGALPALKTFTLRWCDNFANFPRDFSELISLEKLYLEDLPLMSRIPDSFGKLKKLIFLDVCNCSQLETLSEDFENMATLEQLRIFNCPELEGAMMEKILKLRKCYRADIDGSKKLVEKWKHMQGDSEHPIVVVSKVSEMDEEEEKRAIRVCLLHGKCKEVKNGSDELMERPSLFAGLKQGSTATVALIMLPIHMQPHQHRILHRVVEMETKRAETSPWGNLQIVCARKVDLDAERPTATEEEAREGGGIRQILLSLPKGSCVIPSSQFKRVKILTYCFDFGASRTSNDKLSIFTANVWSMEGRKMFESLKFTGEDEISGNVPPPLEIITAENKHYNGIQKLIKSICPVPQHPQQSMYLRIAEGQSESQRVAGESKTREFTDALKDNGIHYLLTANNTRTVMVDDLHGKTIGFMICDLIFLKCINMQQIYKDLQQKDSNFIWIWIPTEMPKGGHGSYTRLIQDMPWATCPHPQLVTVENRYPLRTTYFVLLDKHGQIANCDALPLLLAWGVKSYPFTHNTIPESLSLVESESCLEFFLQGMNIVGRKQMRSKITFLYAEDPSRWFKMKSKLEELSQIRGNFEVLYVGHFSERDISLIENVKRDYEDATQNMRWSWLSLSDMIKFWYRCKYMASKEVYELSRESSMMMQLHGFANQLYHCWSSLVLLDNDGPVTYRGEDVVQMICEPSDEIGDGEGRMVKDELMKSLSSGECSPIVKTFFRDEILNHPPQHPQYFLTNY